MIVAVLKETTSGENRVAATPKTVKELIKSGLTVRVQSGAGESSFYSDQDYIDGGAVVTPDASSTLNGSDMIIKVAPVTLEEMNFIPDGSIYISLLQTARELDLVNKLSDKKVFLFLLYDTSQLGILLLLNGGILNLYFNLILSISLKPRL